MCQPVLGPNQDPSSSDRFVLGLIGLIGLFIVAIFCLMGPLLND